MKFMTTFNIFEIKHDLRRSATISNHTILRKVIAINNLCFYRCLAVALTYRTLIHSFCGESEFNLLASISFRHNLLKQFSKVLTTFLTLSPPLLALKCNCCTTEVFAKFGYILKTSFSTSCYFLTTCFAQQFHCLLCDFSHATPVMPSQKVRQRHTHTSAYKNQPTRYIAITTSTASDTVCTHNKF